MTPADLRALCTRVLDLDEKATPNWCGDWRDGTVSDDAAQVASVMPRMRSEHLALVQEYRTAAPVLAKALIEALGEIERLSKWTFVAAKLEASLTLTGNGTRRPLTDEELTQWAAACERAFDVPWNTTTGTKELMLRLLATIAARDATIAKLRADAKNDTPHDWID